MLRCLTEEDVLILNMDSPKHNSPEYLQWLKNINDTAKTAKEKTMKFLEILERNNEKVKATSNAEKRKCPENKSYVTAVESRLRTLIAINIDVLCVKYIPNF